MLKDVHADMLKIDMGFLKETENKKRSETILGAIIGLADSLGMDVLTEGVETEDQLKSLIAMGCSKFQGYYFSRPIPVAEFERIF
jgi:EAL domain-containing protein (putative c-di-GMP-specific phosphodiesterase class I)